MNFAQNFTPFQHLPLFAKVAIERLDGLADRTNIALDSMLDAYAATYGIECDVLTRESAHHICARRFLGSFEVVGMGIRL